MEKEFWQKVSQKLTEHGVVKTATQCNSKWTLLKEQYKNKTAKKQQTGSGRDSWEYYDEMHEIMFHKPEINPPALASSVKGYETRILENMQNRKRERKKEKEQKESSDEENDESDEDSRNKKKKSKEIKKKKRQTKKTTKDVKFEALFQLALDNAAETKRAREEYFSLLRGKAGDNQKDK